MISLEPSIDLHYTDKVDIINRKWILKLRVEKKIINDENSLGRH